MKNRMEKLMEKAVHNMLATAAQMKQCYSIHLLQKKKKNTKATPIYLNNLMGVQTLDG